MTYGAVHCCTWAYGDNASLYAVWMGFTAPYTDASTCGMCQRTERRRTQGWRKQRKVQNMPLIWRMLYHATNSSHVTDHFLSTLRWALHCVLLEIALNAGSVVLQGVATGRHRAARSAWIRAVYPGRMHGMLAHFMVRLYIAVVCNWQPTVLSYGEALADRIVSRYFVWYRIVSIVLSYGGIVPSLAKSAIIVPILP